MIEPIRGTADFSFVLVLMVISLCLFLSVRHATIISRRIGMFLFASEMSFDQLKPLITSKLIGPLVADLRFFVLSLTSFLASSAITLRPAFLIYLLLLNNSLKPSTCLPWWISFRPRPLSEFGTSSVIYKINTNCFIEILLIIYINQSIH